MIKVAKKIVRELCVKDRVYKRLDERKCCYIAEDRYFEDVDHAIRRRDRINARIALSKQKYPLLFSFVSIVHKRMMGIKKEV